MADCGDHTHQMIEYANLFDLRDMQLLRAEINSIDRVNNTADITLLDTCDVASGLDLTTVSFFYHCENSDGTEAALLNGHSAFLPTDVVYVVFLPENGAVAQRLYIVGHVDIRGTRRCMKEYVLITLPYRESSVLKYVFVIFDPSTGLPLDIDAFENIDELSPAKPTQHPGLYTTAVTDWITYNLEAVTPITDVPCNVFTELITNNTTAAYSETVDGTTYTGDVSAACVGFDLGNESYSYSFESTVTQVEGKTTITKDQQRTGSGTKSYPAPGDSACFMYWEGGADSYKEEFYNGANYLKIRIVDTISSTNYDMPVELTYFFAWEKSYSCNGTTATLGYSTEDNLSIEFDATNIGGPVFIDAESLTSSATFSTDVDANGIEVVDVYASTDSGYLCSDASRPRDSNHFSGWTKKLAIGELGVYFVTGYSYYWDRWDVSDEYYAFFTSISGDIGGTIKTSIPGWAGDVLVYIDASPTPPATTSQLGVFPFGVVALFDETFDVSQDVPIGQCFSSRIASISDGLANAVKSLYALVNTTLGNDAINIGDSFFYLKTGPTLAVIKRKIA